MPPIGTYGLAFGDLAGVEGGAAWWTLGVPNGTLRVMAELPSGTVTFLFTDLEGSTRLWEQQPEAMQAALARHDEILADAVAAHGGQIVKTTGDGLHAAFETADDAVAAAVAGQHAMRTEPWQLLEPLRVRMGVHTGVAELRGHDYYGTVLNRAARLMSAAHPNRFSVRRQPRIWCGTRCPDRSGWSSSGRTACATSNGPKWCSS